MSNWSYHSHCYFWSGMLLMLWNSIQFRFKVRGLVGGIRYAHWGGLLHIKCHNVKRKSQRVLNDDNGIKIKNVWTSVKTSYHFSQIHWLLGFRAAGVLSDPTFLQTESKLAPNMAALLLRHYISQSSDRDRTCDFNQPTLTNTAYSPTHSCIN